MLNLRQENVYFIKITIHVFVNRNLFLFWQNCLYFKIILILIFNTFNTIFDPF